MTRKPGCPLTELEQLLQWEKAGSHFRNFVKFMMPEYEESWHHTLIIDRLEKLMHEKDQRVMISLAPRHGKSELVSRMFPCYYLGKNPDKEVIACSYSSGLATIFSRDVQRRMESEKYMDIFPDTIMGGTERAKKIELHTARSRRTSDFFEIVGRRGKFMSAGVGGAITGRGGNLLLLDDPVKNSEEADSEIYREKIWSWYRSTFYTRAEKGANILLIMTRWHRDDLAGRLIKEMRNGGDNWEIIELPAINVHGPNSYDPRDKGEALWPGKYPLNRLEVIKKQLGPRDWSSLYQSNPIVEGGNIIKEDWIKYYTQLDFNLHKWRECQLIISWDASFKETGKSYVVGSVIARHNDNFYLVDFYRKKAGMSETIKAIKAMSKKYPTCRSVLIEDKANGTGIIDILNKAGSRVTPVTPELSKDERLHAISPIFESGNFFLPQNHPEVNNIIEELISFPQSENDDIVDSISQGLNKFMTLSGIHRLRASTRWE